jgi:hypothetical protein
MTTFLKDNPRRPADWRWQRASSMVEDGERLSRKRDDEWTRKSVHFLRAFDNCETDTHRRALAESDSDMYWAYDIYQAEGDPTRIAACLSESLKRFGNCMATCTARAC